MGAVDQGADEANQEGAVRRRRVERLEWGEARRLAVAQGEIGPAAGAHEDLGPPVLVDEQLLGAEAFELGQHEVLDDRLARSGRPADEGVAQIADVEVEPERRAGRGAQHRDRLAPVGAARLADRMGVERRQGREIARGDGGRPGAAGEGAGELGPEGRLQSEILPGHDQTGIGENGARLG